MDQYFPAFFLTVRYNPIFLFYYYFWGEKLFIRASQLLQRVLPGTFRNNEVRDERSYVRRTFNNEMQEWY